MFLHGVDFKEEDTEQTNRIEWQVELYNFKNKYKNNQIKKENLYYTKI